MQRLIKIWAALALAGVVVILVTFEVLWHGRSGAPIGVPQKLMRHAQVSTTMNVYGNALMEAKREANSKVVRMALRSASR